MSYWGKIITGDSLICNIVIETPTWWHKEAPERESEMIAMLIDELEAYAPMVILESPKSPGVIWDVGLSSFTHRYTVLTSFGIFKGFRRFINTRIPRLDDPTKYGKATLYLVQRDLAPNQESREAEVLFFTVQDGKLCNVI